MSNSESTVTTLDGPETADSKGGAAAAAPAAAKTAAKAKGGAAAGATGAGTGAVGAAPAEGQQMYKLTIPKTREQTGPVFVAVDTYAYNIPRGIPCKVPQGVIDVLTNAVERVFDDGGVGEDVQRHSFTAVAIPADAEV